MTAMDTSARLSGHPAVLASCSPISTSAPRLQVGWARHAEDVQAAQVLRWRVFAEEMGAQLSPPPGTPAGLDVDRWDAHCEHLMVWTLDEAGGRQDVVGTYRVLTPDGARRAGGWYSDAEFDLAPLDGWRSSLAEVGRSCTAPGWRQGGVVMMLWGGLTQFMQRNGLRGVLGCASVPMRDGGHAAASLWARLRQTHLVEPELRVQPRLALPVHELDDTLDVEPPPLIKGYLRCGARLLGAPAWDPDFGVADLPVLQELERMPAAYRARLLRG
ncbi:MAG: hypothetical protein RLY78_4141 [Pseudomonadota bacterium]